MSSLLRATAISLVVAAIILVIAVLPAEFGVDPTGIGGVLGLSQMGALATGGTATTDVPSSGSSPASAETVTKTDAPMRFDEMSATLQPDEGAEIKVEMRAGESFVFEWRSEGGPVNFDMHGEGPNAGDTSTSYWAGQQMDAGAGVFVAPITGTHGWFWRNRTDGPVTVKVHTSGFYTRLFRAE